MSEILSGIDILKKNSFQILKNKTVAILANQSAVDKDFNHLVDLVFNDKSINLKLILAPEHGFRGTAQDMISVADSVDSRTNVPIKSLYGKGADSLAPSKEDLKDIDILLVDLPDIGSRYYTFAQTAGYCLEAAKETGTKVIILDRPNPINGSTVEGYGVSEGCRSFCGHLPTSNRHGLTLGELVRGFNEGFRCGGAEIAAAGAELEIIECTGWKRESYHDETNLPWVIPSPNMPTLETAIVYPGGCLFEATNISEGRGTTRPFEIVGASYIDPYSWIEETRAVCKKFNLEGFKLRPLFFEPKFHKFANQTCGGVQIHIKDREIFKPLRLGLTMIWVAAQLYKGNFSWRKTTYEFIDSVPAIDLLYGNGDFRRVVENGSDLGEIFNQMSAFESEFASTRSKLIIY